MKKIALAVLSLGLLVSGCSAGADKDEKVAEKSGKAKEQSVVPKYAISDEYYKTTIPFDGGNARGLVVQGLNSRLDIDEFETGLMRIAKESFSTKDNFLKGGKALDTQTIQMLVKRKRTDAEQKELEDKLKKDAVKFPNIGLNPALGTGSESLEVKNKKNPIYISNILEHDYYVKKGDNGEERVGMVVGLAMNSVQYFNEEHGYPREAAIPDEKMLAEGKKMAQEILKVIHQKEPETKNIPITFAIYRQAPKSSLVPGNFVSYANAEKGSETVEDWQQINEKYYLFPSEQAKTDNKREDLARVSNFKAKLSDYFQGDYTAVIGTGMYRDDELREMKLDIPVQFNGKAEIVGFTQYVAGLVMEYFPNYMKVQVTIKSVERPEAIIIREAKQDEPLVKILD
ncbi:MULTISPECIES: CamS family sex pheromone protein [Bacillus]|jgi:protein involved in sex pheromone biosynthesis|uniref:CamS family sex pheromone protein n=4 Tax=Bacillus cereus group TaxID=86661 RepID=A0A9X5ZBU7_BACCE|nr:MULTISPECIES: CamS family sex pheromone protein [Bacillus]MBJ6718757.1 CamS family sex pheromone protein [Bacillus sp. PR5]MDV8113991.1 CamS family sex pheromone protein [Bacillus sp. BAU-SS-2023]MEB4841062.1 CamS family sex pheromone protein [Paenibacillus jamilae]PPI92741.1 CamS family sex pheromone protein [Escherichia coli]CJB69775.1 Protein involved in sex pheromone biosynthesis [Streptococcus pneumoniae]